VDQGIHQLRGQRCPGCGGTGSFDLTAQVCVSFELRQFGMRQTAACCESAAMICAMR
jgi:hypothetical protein